MLINKNSRYPFVGYLLFFVVYFISIGLQCNREKKSRIYAISSIGSAYEIKNLLI